MKEKLNKRLVLTKNTVKSLKVKTSVKTGALLDDNAGRSTETGLSAVTN